MPAEPSGHPLVAGRYRLDGVIGSGGVGRVWRGEDTVLRRAVAVKEVPLPSHLPDEERAALRTRVLREAQAAARIHHPGSVQVYDVVEGADTVHLVMELVDDLTLAEVVARDGPLSPRATAAMGVELLGALEAAHAVGIVHRDVKPRNVMVLPTGGVKLADFGIASLRDDPSITKTGMVLGTPSYMSPEQALGEAVGPPTDVWGTGALLYFAVEGRPPFDRGEPLATLHAVVNGEPQPRERAGPLGEVLDQLLVKDPAQRLTLGAARTRLASVAAPGTVTGATAPTERQALSATATPTLSTAAASSATLHDERMSPVGTARASRPAAPRGTSRATPYAAVAAVLLLLLVGGIALAARDDARDAGVAGGSDPTPATTPAAEVATTAPPSTTTSPEETTATTPPEAVAAQPEGEEDREDRDREDREDREDRDGEDRAGEGGDDDGRPAGVPASWERYTAPSIGWSIWHPPSWKPTRASGNAVDFRDPSSGSYLRVDHIQPPSSDPVEAWERSSARFADRYPDYQELRIEPTTYQGHQAALWEYTYAGQHATNLGFITPGTGFALNFQTPASRWEDAQDLRRGFEAGFTTPS